MADVKINYGVVETTVTDVNQEAARGLEEEISTVYQEMYDLLAESAGESVESIREQLLEEKELAVRAAKLYQEIARLIKKASDEFQKLDNRKAMTTVSGQ